MEAEVALVITVRIVFLRFSIQPFGYYHVAGVGHDGILGKIAIDTCYLKIGLGILGWFKSQPQVAVAFTEKFACGTQRHNYLVRFSTEMAVSLHHVEGEDFRPSGEHRIYLEADRPFPKS